MRWLSTRLVALALTTVAAGATLAAAGPAAARPPNSRPPAPVEPVALAVPAANASDGVKLSLLRLEAYLATPAGLAAVRGWIGMVEAASIDWLASPGLERATVRDFLVDALVAITQVALAPTPSTPAAPRR